MRHKMNTERKIPNESFSLLLGTTDKLSPLALYVEGKVIISPIEDSIDYTNIVNEIRKALTAIIREFLLKNSVLDKVFLLDTNIALKQMRMGKKTPLSFQITFRQHKNNILPFNDIYDHLESSILKMMQSFKECILSNKFLILK